MGTALRCIEMGGRDFMLSAALLLFANTLLFSLRLSGSGSFPKPLSAAEEREYLERYAKGDRTARDVLIERNLRLVAHSSRNTTPRAPIRRI
jgi:RNA polymerase sporulation-specific sigma factor